MHIRDESHIKPDRYYPSSDEGHKTEDLKYENFDILPQKLTPVSIDLFSADTARQSLDNTEQDEGTFYKATRCDGQIRGILWKTPLWIAEATRWKDKADLGRNC